MIIGRKEIEECYKCGKNNPPMEWRESIDSWLCSECEKKIVASPMPLWSDVWESK